MIIKDVFTGADLCYTPKQIINHISPVTATPLGQTKLGKYNEASVFADSLSLQPSIAAYREAAKLVLQFKYVLLV